MRLRLLVASIVVAAAAGCAAPTDGSVSRVIVLSGTIDLREPMNVDPDDRVRLRLLDVTRLNDAPEVVVEKEWRNAGQAPIPFEISVDRAATRPAGVYALDAMIYRRDRLLYAMRDPTVIALEDAPADCEILLVRVQ